MEREEEFLSLSFVCKLKSILSSETPKTDFVLFWHVSLGCWLHNFSFYLTHRKQDFLGPLRESHHFYWHMYPDAKVFFFWRQRCEGDKKCTKAFHCSRIPPSSSIVNLRGPISQMASDSVCTLPGPGPRTVACGEKVPQRKSLSVGFFRSRFEVGKCSAWPLVCCVDCTSQSVTFRELYGGIFRLLVG